MFIMPIIPVIGYRYTEQRLSTFNKNKLHVLICNRDTGVSGAQLVEAINKIGMFKVVDLPKDQNEKTIVDSLKKKDALISIIVPTDFTAKVMAKSKSVSDKALTSFIATENDRNKKCQDIDHMRCIITRFYRESMRLSVIGALKSSLQLVESRQTLRTLYFSINEKPLPEKLEDEMLNNKAVIHEIPVSRNGTLKSPNAAQHNVPAWTIFAMFFIIMSLGGSVVREKISGSFIRLKTLPTNYLVGMLSKQITYVGVTIVQAVVIFSLGIWLFPLLHLPALNLPQDIFGLFVVTLVCGWCAWGYAICVGVFAETHHQNNGFGAISIVILAAFGGLMVPTFTMDTSLRKVANLSPMHWCLESYYGLFLQNGRLSDVVGYLLPLILFTLLLQLVSFWGLKRKNLI